MYSVSILKTLSGLNVFDLIDDYVECPKVGWSQVNNFRFIDDTAFIKKTLQRAQELGENVDQESSRYGKEISRTKTQWMRARPKADKTREKLTKLKRK